MTFHVGMQEREFDALHGVRNLDATLMSHILRPSLLKEIGSHYNDPVSWLAHRHPRL